MPIQMHLQQVNIVDYIGRTPAQAYDDTSHNFIEHPQRLINNNKQ